ncbi:MAG: hypothetical protein LBD23_08200 [Oscillospiraceae bacterium]|jgi:phosphopantothenate-cysteine ligase|nr:hypothetical protein [Oscillospiraceae bacterium]
MDRMKKEIKVLVTAGDTYEAIDDVRKITHMATGRLGCLIADEFINKNAAVTFICGERSLRPEHEMENTIIIQGVKSLEDAVIEQISKTQFDSVVHTMAVSDYTIRGLTTEDDIANGIYAGIMDLKADINPEQVKNMIRQIIMSATKTTEGKISSEHASLIIAMDNAPKVISHIKQIQKNTVLVGFKLLSGVKEHELIQAAQYQIHSNRCDFVLANDLSGINGDIHRGILLDMNGILDRLTTKQEIAQSIVSHVIKKIRRHG